MARIQQDQFIDEDEEEEVCPLCVEEFDLGDRYFKPCPCGYQICQFCYNNIKNNMNGLCPACRRPYDEKPFSFKHVSPEEQLAHEKAKLAQQKKRAAAKAKEIQKRDAENMSRKHLAGLRVRQRNLVYVTGMRPKIQGDRVAELLRGKEYFGQYGDIIKVVVSKGKDATSAQAINQPVGIYVTFSRKEDAAACIEAINAQDGGDGKIRAQHGTTKYCSAYLRGETCNNRNCMFLHEPGESAESFTRQDLSNMNAYQTQQPSAPGEEPAPPPPQHPQPVAAAIQDPSPSSPAGNSALPAGAGWARRGSRATSSSFESPAVSHPQPAGKESKSLADAKSSKDASSVSSPSRPPSSASRASRKKKSKEQLEFENLFKTAFHSNLRFNFAAVGLSEEDIKLLENLPPLWDPQGGAKRRVMKEREAEELRKAQELEEKAKAEAASQPAPQPQAASEEAEAAMGGSLQLGGEPEEQPNRPFANQQPPGLPFGSQFGLDNDLASLSLRGNPPTHAQQHSQNLLRQFQTAGAGQQHQIGAHGRQPSRFSFNESGGIKAGAGLGMQQGAKIGQAFGAAPQQAPFYSGVQGPPPGLKTTGTPPVNGSGMFGQGHGFTSAYGNAAHDPRAAMQGRDAKPELPALGQALDTSRRSTPKLPPGLDVSRRGTPSLPPGLFPQLEPTSTESLPQNEAETSKEIEPGVTSKVDERPVAPESTPVEAKGKGKAVVPEHKAQAQVLDKPITKEPAAIEETPKDPTPAEMAAASKDPTPAEMAASRKKARTVSVKQTKKASMTKAAVPETPVRSKKEVKEEVKAESTPTKASPEKKADTPATTSKRPHPGKLNLDLTPEVVKEEKREVESPQPPSATSKVIDASRPSRAASLSTSISSRPGTPLASTVATGSPLKRTVQPRTLRITAETPKVETPPALPTTSAAATPATSTPPPPLPAIPQHIAEETKPISRRTSIASLHQPGTPLTERTDTISLASTSMPPSRASSPPPGPIVGKKSRKKKSERKEKEAFVDAVVAGREEVKEEVAPIMARKTKKKGSSKARSDGPVEVKPKKEAKTKPNEPVIKEEKVEVVDDPVVEEVVNEDFGKAKVKDVPPTPPMPATPPPKQEPGVQEKKKEDINPLTAQAILQALDSTHQLALSTLNLLKPLTSQSSLKQLGIDPFTSADLQNHIEQLRFELTKADEALLKQGQTVRKDLGAKSSRTKNRTSGKLFVSRQGTRLSCLTPEEEARYAELEERLGGEKGISRWGGADGAVKPIGKKDLKPKQKKLEDLLAQSDLFGPLEIAAETLEAALRTATKGANAQIKIEYADAQGHLVPNTAQPAPKEQAQDPLNDAREYANIFWPRVLDPHPPSVAVPPEQENLDELHPRYREHLQRGQAPVQQISYGYQQDTLAEYAPRPPPVQGQYDLNLPPLPPNLPVSSSSTATDASTVAAMDTLKEAMATASSIAKLGASEALKVDPAAMLQSWNKAVSSSGGDAKGLHSALEKVVRDVSGAGFGQGMGGKGAAMSMAELERESLFEKVAEAKRESVEWEKRLNKVVRGNRRAALGHN